MIANPNKIPVISSAFFEPSNERCRNKAYIIKPHTMVSLFELSGATIINTGHMLIIKNIILLEISSLPLIDV